MQKQNLFPNKTLNKKLYKEKQIRKYVKLISCGDETLRLEKIFYVHAKLIMLVNRLLCNRSVNSHEI